MTITTRAEWDWITRQAAKPFVLECDHDANTNGLGKIQRAIVDYLGTAPAGFDDTVHGYRGPYHGDARLAYCQARGWSSESQVLWHSGPLLVRVSAIAAAVYRADEPTPSQLRVVQRNVRRLEQLGLVVCRHGCAGYVDRSYTQWNGKPGVMPQAVAALFAAFRWNCQHFAEQDRLAPEWHAEYSRTLATVNPIQALQGLM